MRLVLDASALVPFLADDSESLGLEPILMAGHEMHVPALCDAEVVGGLAKHVRRGWVTDSVARDALIDYVSLPIIRHMHLSQLARTYELAANFAASDASYVALAEALDASLVTLDGPLGRAVRRHTSVEVLP